MLDVLFQEEGKFKQYIEIDKEVDAEWSMIKKRCNDSPILKINMDVERDKDD